MKEKTIHGLLVRNWEGKATGDRIESVAGSGIPDSNWISGGIEFWLEYKVMDKSYGFDVRPSQVAWHARRRSLGSRAFLAARNEDTIMLCHYEWKQAQWVRDFLTSKPFDYDGLLSRILLG
jgi:hypothetical protein